MQVFTDEVTDEWVIETLKTNENNFDLPTRLDRYPKADECYLFRKDRDINDYRKDGWVWHQSSTYAPENKTLKKIYRYVMIGFPKKEPCKGFRKEEYFLPHNSNVKLVIYRGDHHIAPRTPHGNSKRPEPFNATLPSTLRKIREEHNYGSIQASYNSLKKTIRRSNHPKCEEDEEFIESHIVPRDSRQLINMRQDINRKSTLHYDELLAIQLLAGNEFCGMIRWIQTFPEVMIVFTHPSALELAKRLLDHSTKYINISQVINYDTTFEVSAYYLSILSMKNIELEGEPAFPVMFLFHDRKHEQVHEFFWRDHVLKHLKIPQRVPIVTDREKSIVRAIQKNNLTANHLFCSNHILRDVKAWLRKKNAPHDNYSVYSNMITELVSCKTRVEFEAKSKELKSQMASGFCDYFEEFIESDLRDHVAHFIASKFPAFRNTTPTTNQAEGCNTMIKSYLKTMPKRVDIVLLKLLELQIEKMDEFNRAIKGFGDSRVLARFKKTVETVQINCYLYRQSIPSLIEKIKGEIDVDGGNDGYKIIENHMSDLAINQKLIGWDPILQVHTVRGPFSHLVYAVQNVNGKLTCNCKNPGKCFHITAVESKVCVSTPIEHKKSIKLASISKKQGRSGKKKPRNIDYVIPFEPADDSIIISSQSCKDLNREKDLNDAEHPTNGVGYPTASDGDHENSNDAEHSTNGVEYSAGSDGNHENLNDAEHPTNGVGYSAASDGDHENSNDAEHPTNGVGYSAASDDDHENLNDAEHPTNGVEYSDNPEQLNKLTTISPTPKKALLIESEVPEYFKLGRTRKLDSLAPKKWISGFVLDDFIQHIINCYEKNASILLLNSAMYCLFVRDEKKISSRSQIVRFLQRNQAVNRDLVLVIITTDPLGEGLHWILGVLLFKTKTITILDSMAQSSPIFFDHLMKICGLCYSVANIGFNANEWACIQATDIPKQKNHYDCGLFVCFYAHAIVKKIPFYEKLSDQGRNWIKYVLSKAPKTIDTEYGTMRYSISLNLGRMNVGSSVKIQPGEAYPIVKKCQEHPSSVIKCSANHCHFVKGIKNDKMDLCIACREWFHQICHLDFDCTYFICTDCKRKDV